MKETCSQVGIVEQKTNHSLRGTGTTALFKVNIPETLS